jgi:Uma2 family endonuclease
LEEKGVSEKLTTESYEWFFELLRYYLRETKNGQLLALETGFRLVLPDKTTIRKPDLAVILNSNPVRWEDQDHFYRGIGDLCVEALSDSSTAAMERDTVTKFTEYAQAGVKEYYILYAYGDPQEFYQLTPQGVYVPMPRRDRDIICSEVLPGFQFRVSDLQRHPSPEEMSEDHVYQGFMLLKLQALRAFVQQAREARLQEQEARLQKQEARQVAEAHAQQEQEAHRREREARQVAEAHAQQEREARLQEREARQAIEAKIRQLEAELARFRQSQESASS